MPPPRGMPCRPPSSSPAPPPPSPPPRPSTYPLLNVRIEEGFVVHLPEQRRYGLGVGAYEIGSAYLRQDPLRWIAQTVLTRLLGATHHNAPLPGLDGRDG